MKPIVPNLTWLFELDVVVVHETDQRHRIPTTCTAENLALLSQSWLGNRSLI
jgi:hypothetical protein